VNALDHIGRELPGRCREGVPLSGLCTWHIGGPAALLAEPATVEELVRLMAVIRDGNLPWWLIGNGSNLLFPDEGLPGVVIRLGEGLAGFGIEGTRLLAGAAAPVGSLARAAAREGLSGLEFLVGIPALLGGALRMNAGAHGMELAAVVRRVHTLNREGVLAWHTAEELGFGYRQCHGLESRIALQAELELVPAPADEVGGRTREFNRYRQQTQPLKEWSCGSVFKRPGPDLYPGRLIEDAGMKGFRLGGIQVSPVHANFLVNTGEGTAAQVLDLVERIKRAVFEHSGIRLEEEFHTMGMPDE
jgi:UDP-N-acetylmuramate dehydrogenase